MKFRNPVAASSSIFNFRDQKRRCKAIDLSFRAKNTQPFAQAFLNEWSLGPFNLGLGFRDQAVEQAGMDNGGLTDVLCDGKGRHSQGAPGGGEVTML